MIELKNEFFTVQINEFGAELWSVKSPDGHEFIWQGDEKYWPGRCPVLFPICGRLLQKEYSYKGKTYPLGTHGFARDKMFRGDKISDTCAVFTLTDDEQTRAVYPFSFRFEVRFELDGNALRITYTAHNTGSETMYYNFGSHEAFATDGKYEDWSIEFEKTENLRLREQPVLGYMSRNVLPFRENVKELPLSHSLFDFDALIFDELKSRSVTLKHCGRPVAEVDFAGLNYLLLWAKVGAPYICIEPWGGLPDYLDSTKDITKKDAIWTLEAGKSFSLPHTIRFFR